MRLKHIKLAGFKSFVDATTVPFPDQMTAIVGPNGCGKSNIIDAVRWVLGESSAKNLRGDAMIDVIFNGSTKRKPVSQASVELVFDNNEGRIEGNLADRVEISVKRQVNKDAQSTYFLNGTKCRRRDITDIFLGTGLGPRSYAIIEQGMISRLIESKPQELRVFIEEAAGISKYKERRRETENRIKHTRENLLRLEDVREELGTQLEKLKRQAATAKRYKELKTQERKLKAELYALKWHKYNEQLNVYEKERLEKEAQLEAFVAEQRGGELGMLQYKQQHQTLSDKIQAAQQQDFQLSNQITRIEQQKVFAAENRQKQSEEFAQLQMSLDDAEQHIEVEQESLYALEESLAVVEPEQAIIDEQLEEGLETLADAEHKFDTRQSAWEKLQKLAANVLQNSQVVKTKIQGHQLQSARLTKRKDEINKELQDFELQSNEQELSACIDELTLLNTRLEASASAINEQQNKLSIAAQDKIDIEQQYLATNNKLVSLQAKLDGLKQWQTEHELQTTGKIAELLADSKVVNSGALLTQLEVEPNWAYIIEDLLSYMGSPILVDRLPDAGINGQFVIKDELSCAPGSIATKVKTGSFPSWFNLVGFAETPEQAQQLLNHETFASVVTNTGQWLGKNWSCSGPCQSDVSDTGVESGVLKRLQQISELTVEVELQEHALEDVNQSLIQSRELHSAQQNTLDDLQKQRQTLEQKSTELHMQVRLLEQQLTQQQRLIDKLHNEAELIVHQLEEEQTQIWGLEQEFELVEMQNLEHESQLAELENDKQNLSEQVKQAKHQVDLAKTQKHQLELKCQNIQSQLDVSRTNIQRAHQHKSQLQSRFVELETSLTKSDDPTAELQLQLEELLEQKILQEEQLNILQAEQAEVAQSIAELEQGQSGVMAKLDKMRSEIESIKLDSEGARIRAQNMLETLSDMDQPLKPILEQMPVDADEQKWAIDLEKTSNSISRLGAINLAAIEEYEIQAERKGYLDDQFNDLTGALDTLESAIKKIDRESRSKFKQTFEQINTDLQVLFPKVFGGGMAYLELTAEDMLDTGVTIMARPPGKKNSTIHLLSGGEKALTALSLVFSIFRLNPAPFCMLDEVDAPLDDANVSRFCNLVKEMSETVQFIFISHNKVAMEMATHLTGVTMQEPGVSRLVAVDIQEAVKMAEAS